MLINLVTWSLIQTEFYFKLFFIEFIQVWVI